MTLIGDIGGLPNINQQVISYRGMINEVMRIARGYVTNYSPATRLQYSFYLREAGQFRFYRVKALLAITVLETLRASVNRVQNRYLQVAVPPRVASPPRPRQQVGQANQAQAQANPARQASPQRHRSPQRSRSPQGGQTPQRQEPQNQNNRQGVKRGGSPSRDGPNVDGNKRPRQRSAVLDQVRPNFWQLIGRYAPAL